jgi:hypothetical protein
MQVLDGLENAMAHWYLAARAAQVHATLRTLRAVDDQLTGRPRSTADRSVLLERAASQVALGTRVSELLEIPAETLDLFTIDRPVVSRIEGLRSTAGWLGGESEMAADRLGLAADRPVEEMLLSTRKGNVVALPRPTPPVD